MVAVILSSACLTSSEELGLKIVGAAHRILDVAIGIGAAHKPKRSHNLHVFRCILSLANDVELKGASYLALTAGRPIDGRHYVPSKQNSEVEFETSLLRFLFVFALRYLLQMMRHWHRLEFVCASPSCRWRGVVL